MYLSGPPLHVLAMHLVAALPRARSATATRSRSRPASTAATSPTRWRSGLVPVTVCTDLLQAGRLRPRAAATSTSSPSAWDGVGARTIDDFVIRAYGHGEAALERAAAAIGERSASDAALSRRARGGSGSRDRRRAGAVRALGLRGDGSLNTPTTSTRTVADPRYAPAAERQAAAEDRPPPGALRLHHLRQVRAGLPQRRQLHLRADPAARCRSSRSRRDGAGWSAREEGTLRDRASSTRSATSPDFCNECGNCDVFCPEDGGPYVVKPRFFGTLAAWQADGRATGSRSSGEKASSWCADASRGVRRA